MTALYSLFFPAAVKQGTVNEAQPTAPPKHIQEMKKSALMLIRGSYIEESDFNDDVMVYRLCADKDAQDSVESHAQKVNAGERSADQKAPLSNGLAGETTQGAPRDPVSEKQSLASANPEQGTEMEHSGQGPAHGDQNQEDGVNVESKGSNLSMETEDFLSQYHDLLAKLNYNPNELVALNLNTSEPSTPTEDEDDFEKFTVAPHSDNLTFPFGPKAHLMFSHNPARIHGAPFTGPFISVLLSKTENMLENELHVNLLLTGIIAQLACYPQPLLRSFLLNTNMVFQPSVRSLYQVLASVKNSIEHVASTRENFASFLTHSHEHLLTRVGTPSSQKEPADKESEYKTPSSAQNPQQLLNSFSKTVMPSGVKSAINAAVIFTEFLKELAAIAQEHSILSHSALADCEE